MTEQTNPPEGEPEAPSDAAAGAEAKPAAPAHRGPPIEVAVEVLDERGEETAIMLAKVAGAYAVESGGRDDLPWVVVQRAHLVEVARGCKESAELAMDMLHCQFAVDYEDRIQMVYVLFSMARDRKAILRVDLAPDDAKVDTVTGLWEAASWYERETHDLFGVEFTGSPDMSPLLLFEGFDGHPGLKSYPLNDYQEW